MNKPDKPRDESNTHAKSKFRHERVTPDEDGQRVDNYLIKRCPGVPRSHIYRLIRTGDVRVDGRRIKQTRKLISGEQVRIPTLQVTPRDDVHVPDKLARAAGQAVVLEHADFLIVNKPAGIAVHGGTGLAFGLIDALRQYRQEPALELSHRLDRATSGCLLVGRSLGANRRLQNLFRQKTITKRYIALVDGRWPDSLKKIEAPLMKNVEHAGERRVIVDSAGQDALTHFSITRRFKDATELNVQLDTGRTHQIRVHTRHAGHAVIGDQRYGDNVSNTRFKKRGLGRLFLHSCELAFQWNEESIQARVPVGDEWQAAIKRAFE